MTEIPEVSTNGSSTFGRFGALISIIQIYANEHGGHLIMLINLILFYVMLIRLMLFYLTLIRLILFYANYLLRWESHKADRTTLRSPHNPEEYITQSAQS